MFMMISEVLCQGAGGGSGADRHRSPRTSHNHKAARFKCHLLEFQRRLLCGTGKWSSANKYIFHHTCLKYWLGEHEQGCRYRNRTGGDMEDTL